jgi:uncharacterized membrane protein
MAKIENMQPIIDSNARDYQDAGITSTVSVLGHPLHPLLVTFPIAFLLGALGTDVGYWLSQDPFWARASVWLLGIGFASGVLAALSGMLDFLKIDRVRKRNAGWVHMFGNIAALLITFVNWFLRWGNPAEAVLPLGIILSLLVSAVLGITGWYGRELAYRHKVGVIGSSSRRET